MYYLFDFIIFNYVFLFLFSDMPPKKKPVEEEKPIIIGRLSTNLKCGIVGLPNVGKSTFFNVLTKTQIAAAENFPFCTIDPNENKYQFQFFFFNFIIATVLNSFYKCLAIVSQFEMVYLLARSEFSKLSGFLV